MAASTNCKTCNHKISFDVKSCPSCGQKSPIPFMAGVTHSAGDLLLGIIVIAIIFGVLGGL